MKPAISTPRRIFRPRLLPRNKYDWRLIAFLFPLMLAVFLPVAIGWIVLPMAFVIRMTGDPLLAMLTLLMQWALWTLFFLTPMVHRLELDEQGVHLPGAFKTLHIAWDEIESVKVVTIGEMLRASLRWPFRDPSLRFSNSPFTFSQYIRIKHKRGTAYFAANETEELLTLLLARRPVVEPVTAAWYTAPTVAVSSESGQRIRLGRGGL